MGCCAAKGIPGNEQILPEMKLEGLDPTVRFEYSLPFYRVRLNNYIAQVKKYSLNKKSISHEDLKLALCTSAVWKDFLLPHSVLNEVLKSRYFKHEDGNISTESLILYGIIHCSADIKERVHALYDVFQDNNQEYIAANDKDFIPGFD
jgi:hypothetical protein